MFTGIIEEVGRVLEAADGVLRIAVKTIGEGTQPGDSIAINGVDLTVADMTQDSMLFNVMPETYRRSNLVRLAPGDPVNLERSVRPSDRLSGHIVRGVVEGTGRLRSAKLDGDAVILTYETPPELRFGSGPGRSPGHRPSPDRNPVCALSPKCSASCAPSSVDATPADRPPELPPPTPDSRR